MNLLGKVLGFWAVCPLCGAQSLEDRYSYEICPICRWEDSGDEFFPDKNWGPNRKSFNEAHEEYLRIGTVDKAFLQFGNFPYVNFIQRWYLRRQLKKSRLARWG